MAAGFAEAAERSLSLDGVPMVAVGYGSCDAAEAIPFHPVSNWKHAAGRIGFAQALRGAIDLTQAQYEALHDGEVVPDLEYSPEGEFWISRVGQQYDPGFQDLGVEYYEYAK
jgi:hydroxymethylglutaryl-CoA synthase